MMSERIQGQCLCGDVKFSIGSAQFVDACHCRMCQRWTGGPFLAIDLYDGDVRFSSDASVTWYNSSDHGRRGFCSICGSNLFFRHTGDDKYWGVLSGSLDLPSGLPLRQEIYIDEKPDFYALAGERPLLTGAEHRAGIEGEKE